MPVLKCTLFFKQQGPGWTETYYKTISDADLASFLPIATTLAQKRILCSGAQTQLYCIRLSREGVFRDVYPRFVSMFGTTAKDSDAATTCVDFLFQNAARTKSKYTYARGVWDEAITVGGVFTPSPSYVAILNAWYAELAAQEWGWMGVTDPVESFITNVVANENKTVAVTMATPLFPEPLANYAQVRISGVGGAIQLNGQFVVKVKSTTTFDTKYPLAIFPYTVGGKVRFSTKVCVPIVHAIATKVGERKVGKPSYQSPGRRRARARV